MLSGHSAAQEIRHLWKFTSGFIGPQIINFENSLSLSLRSQSSLVPPCKISLGVPVCNLLVDTIIKKNCVSCQHLQESNWNLKTEVIIEIFTIAIIICLTITEYQYCRCPRICSICRCHNLVLLSSVFLDGRTYHQTWLITGFFTRFLAG